MPPWDAGLQPERTELAWRRTVLAAATGLAIAGRYAGAGQTVLAIVLPALAVILGLVALRLVNSRVRAIDAALRGTGGVAPDSPGTVTPTHTMPGGGMLMATAGAVALALLAAASYVLSAAL